MGIVNKILQVKLFTRRYTNFQLYHMKKQILIGFILSLLTTIAGSYLYMEFVMKDGFEAAWQWMVETHNQDEILPLGAIPNLLLFYVFNRRKEYYKARGVVIGVVLVALIVFGFFARHLL